MNAVFPGSFDPITTGHLDIIERAAKLCEKLIVLVVKNSGKKGIFSIDERVELVKTSVSEIENVTVLSDDGLTVRFAERHGVDAIIRGSRNIIDFEMELKIAAVNSSISENIETVLLITKPSLSHVSSGVVKELASHGLDLAGYVPDKIRTQLEARFKQVER